MSLSNQKALGAKQLRVTDNLEQLLEVLPVDIRRRLEEQEDVEDLLEIVMASGASRGSISIARLELSDLGVKHEGLDSVASGSRALFGETTAQASKERLHRISAYPATGQAGS